MSLGCSRKFWYDDALLTTVMFVITSGAGKAIYIGPNQVPLLRGCRARG